MSHEICKREIRPVHGRKLTALLAAIIAVIACNRSKGPEHAAQTTFASPGEAGTALFEAANSGKHAALLAIFGPDGGDALFSGDTVKDQNALRNFVSRYWAMNRWRKIKGGGEILYIGTDNYPFPIPLQQDSSGKWFFNTAAGKDEILARRIGRDELTAIAASSAIANAEQQYFGRTGQYAQKLVSDEGKENGLYWPASEGQSPSPLEDGANFAKAVGYTTAGNQPQPFNGYYFRILTKQGEKATGGAKDYIQNGQMTGGFALLAYPATYRNSGIMSFIVGRDGIVYQKDLGEKTAEMAAAMVEYNPGDGWRPAT